MNKNFLVIANSYDSGVGSSVVIFNGNFNIVEIVDGDISEKWLSPRGYDWYKDQINAYIYNKYGCDIHITIYTFSDGYIDLYL
jgi:hypothetical protein